MKKISVPQAMSAGLKEFFAARDISIEIVTEGGDLKVEDTGEECRESTPSILYSRGWITCPTARAIAKNLDLPLAQMGEMLDHLNVKARQCALGCF